MRTILVVLGTCLLVAVGTAAGEEGKKPSENRLRLVCSVAKEGLTILPAEPEAAAKNSATLIVTCDSMRLGSDGSIVVVNATVETEAGILSAKELAIRLDKGRAISFHAPDGGGMRDLQFTAEKVEQPK
jgi:hypothetical protein